MKKMTLALAITASLLHLTYAVAQVNIGPCGNSGGEWKEIIRERLLQNKLAIQDQPVQFRNTVYVPVAFHLVANSNGVGRVAHNRVLEQLCKLNEDFADLNMQFYIKTLRDNINNTAIYQTQFNAGTAMNLLRDPGAVNIWIVDVATPAPPSSGDNGIILGYYNPQRDWVVVRRDQVNANSVTLPHEIGHYFSLDHTHNGWDAQPYSPSMHGTPAPAMSPGFVPTERQDGSNCQTAGDYICDTPPDYNGFGFAGCNYNIAQDPAGVTIDPDEQLFMSYFLNCVRNDYYFSNTQQSLIWADYNSTRRNYIRSSFVPNLTEITETPVLQFPINNETPPGYNQVTFQWTAVNGADFYLLEIDRVATYTLSPLRFVVAGTNTFTVTTLEPNRTYYWRVRPYNAYRTCAISTLSGVFRTNSTVVSVNDIRELSEWTLSPNPVSSAQHALQVSFQAEQSFDGTLRLFDATGRQVRHYGRHRIASGASYLELDMRGLSNGVYLLTLEYDKGWEIKRLVMTQ